MRNIYAILITTTTLLAGCSGSSNNDTVTESLQNDIRDGTRTSLDLRNVYDNTLTSLAGYDLELIGEQIALLADNATVSALSSSTLPGHTIDLDVQGTVQSYSVSSTEYACTMGGTLVIDTLDVNDFLNDYSIENAESTYTFDQCQLNTDQTPVFDGVMAIGLRFDSGRRYNTSESTYQWQDLSWQQKDGTLKRITADLRVYAVSSFDNNDQRQVSITEHTSTDSNGVVTGVQDGSFTLANSSQGGGAINEFTLQTGGHIIDTSGVTINVTTDPDLYRKYVVPSFTGEQRVPFTGQINLIAVELDNNGTRQVDVIYTTSQGDISSVPAQPLTELDVYAP